MPRDKNYTVIKERYGKATKKSARWAKRVRILDIRRDVNLVDDDTGIFRKILVRQRINGTILKVRMQGTLPMALVPTLPHVPHRRDGVVELI